MLELIVLGEIPGTSFIITFAWAAALLSIFGAIIGSAYVRRHNLRSSHQPKRLDDITL